MPAFVGSVVDDPNFSLLEVILKNGRGKIVAQGSPHTRDWFVDRGGRPVIREDYDDRANDYTIYLHINGRHKPIFTSNDARRPLNILGFKNDGNSILIAPNDSGQEFGEIRELTFDGTMSAPVFGQQDKDIVSVLIDSNRYVQGVRYGGLLPAYNFYDATLQDAVTSVQKIFEGASVNLISYSSDYSKLAFYIAGSYLSPAYYVFDRKAGSLAKIAGSYEQVSDQDAAEIITIEYKARDGVKIPAVITRPRNWVQGTKSPLIVLPHGGPESFDSVGFDWLAQFFSSRGYIVFQPNFRGSDGFGAAFREAGHGHWGKGVMQHDITDGVGVLSRSGWIDPEKICIVGASYGGYAALAGGAFTPELYSCVAAIAPVSDLPRMLFDERVDNGEHSWVYDYWKDLSGDPKESRQKLKDISPADNAANFTAPVLLIHGSNDLVVPYRQSSIMEGALKRAGNDVTLIKLSGEDHYLSEGKTRLQTLRALDAFIAEHIGPHPRN